MPIHNSVLPHALITSLLMGKHVRSNAIAEHLNKEAHSHQFVIITHVFQVVLVVVIIAML